MTNPITVNSTKTVTSIIRNGTAIEKMMLAWEWQPQGLFLGDVQAAWYDPIDTANDDWRRNLLTFSEQFDTSAWTKGNATITTDAIAAPNSTQTADALFEATATGYHSATATSTIVATSGQSYTFSFYVKANGRTKGFMSTVSGGGFSVFDITAKTNVFGGNGTNETVTAQTITELANGWFLLTITSNLIGTANVKPVIGIINDAGVSLYAGDITKGLFIWGAQLELGSVATTYQRITDVNTEVRALFPNNTMFQDSIGSAPNAAASTSQTVGLWLDKSKMGIGANGSSRKNLLSWSEEFDNTTSWSAGSSTTRVANQSVNPINGEITADLLRVSPGGTAYIRQTTTQLAGTSYVFSVYAKRVTGRWLSLRNLFVVGGGPLSADAAWFDLQDGVTGVKGSGIASTFIQNIGDGWFRCSVIAIGGNGPNLVDIGMSASNGVQDAIGTEQCYIWGAQLEIGSVATTYQKITSDWLVSIPGNHAIQASTTTRPLFGRSPVSRRNLLTRTEDFGNTAWFKLNGASTIASAVIAPNGSATSTLLYPPSSGTFRQIQQIISVNSGTTYTFSVYVKASPIRWVALRLDSAPFGFSDNWFDLTNISTGTIGSGVTALIADAGDGWRRLSIRKTASSSGSNNFAIAGVNANGSYTSTTNGIDGILIWGAQLEVGSVATTYQKVVTALDVTEAGKPSYAFMRPDLSDDKLTTNMASTKNLLRYTEEFDNGAWSKVNLVIDPNTGETSDPFGGSAANKITASSGTNVSATMQPTTLSGPTGSVVWSIYAKQGTHPYIQLTVTNDIAWYANFDLSNGSVGTTGSGTASITPVGTDGWYRCTLAFTSTSANKMGAIWLVPSASATRGQSLPSSSGTQSVYILGAQLEVDSTATPYEYGGFKGDVVVAGKNGTAYETNVTSPTGVMDLGPLTYTGGTPGILRAVGDVVGYTMARKKFTDVEKAQLVRYYKKRGAKGILTLGPELIANGKFDSDINWTKVGTTSISLGTAILPAISTGIWQQITSPIGMYRISFDYANIPPNNGGATVTLSTVNSYAGTNKFLYSGSATFFIPSTEANPIVGFNLPNAGTPSNITTIDNISVKEIRPEEEW